MVLVMHFYVFDYPLLYADAHCVYAIGTFVLAKDDTAEDGLSIVKVCIHTRLVS